MNLRTLKDFNIENKRVLVRCGFNVPLSDTGAILDDFRIRQTCATIEYLMGKKAKVVLISHLGRPELRDKKYSLKAVAVRLEKLLKREVKFLDDCIGNEVKKEIDKMKPGAVVLLENLRFHKGEKENNQEFAENLAELGEIFIQDAFSVCHRVHSSIVGIPKFLPSGIGFLVEKEMHCLTKLSNEPQRPLVAIVGGVKVETKAKFIEKLSEMADWILIGHLIEKKIGHGGALAHYGKIIRPIDAIKVKARLLDIGPKTIELFKEKISLAKTVVWNGALGKVEEKEFAKGTEEIIKAIAAKENFSVVGGGSLLLPIQKLGLSGNFNHISTGGGAMIDFIVDGELVGLNVLKK